MTKYVLHGGDTRFVNPDNNGFFAAMTLGLEGKVRILLNYFARDESEIDQCLQEDKERFMQNSENKDLEFIVADVNNLATQLENANVMYIRGGNTAQLVKKMKKVNDIEKLFNNKVIGGSSAGVYVLCKYYWENDNSTLGDGLGIFNIKALCHYKPEDKEVVNKLLAYKEYLPLLTLPNHKWIVVYK